MIIREKVRIGDQVVTLETGRIAKQAGGACLVRAGDTIVLVTACGNQEPKPGQGFFPLSVDYQEKTYSAGKIPGGFFKREGKLRDYEVLTSRLIDRPCRPLFPEGYLSEVQIVATVMSFDQQNPPDTLAMIGASAALHISQIPWNGPIAGVRVGRIDGEFIANPTFEQMEQSDCELLVAASRDAIVMVEGEANEISEEDMVEALLFGHRAVQDTLDLIERMRQAVGKPKWAFAGDTTPAILRERVRQVAGPKVRDACSVAHKGTRNDTLKQIRREALELLAPEFPGQEEAIKHSFEDLRYTTMRGQVLEEGRRLDGRDTRTVRPISVELGVLPRAHGSSLFTRGETQAVVTSTLGTARDAQRLDTLQGDQHKRFMLHYNFPPYSVGEVKPMRGPGRREVGHGDLAERALTKVLPSQEEFPYTIRVVSEITESNGSSSMASVCGGALALMDAGVPIKAAVAGVAMGLIKEGEQYAVLTDILGDEDALGDMDFKVCGTDRGVTAIQMDIKIEGLSREILERALEQAREARLHILDRMQRAISAPRPELSQYAPRITQIRVKPDQVRTIIGPGGKMIRAIVDQTGASIDVEDDGTVSVSSADSTAVAKALEIIKSLTTEPEIGEVYEGTVKRIEPYGAFLEILPGKDGLCHISDVDWTHVTNVEDYMKLGDKVPVKLTNIDREGRIRLSRKDALPEPVGLSKLNGRAAEERGREERPARGRELERPERAARSREVERGEVRTGARERSDEERPARGFEREERAARGEREERLGRALEREERAARGEREERPARGFEREERVGRGLEREERPARLRELERETRPARDLDLEREERSARLREPERETRPARDLDREERAAKPRELERVEARGPAREHLTEARGPAREHLTEARGPAREHLTEARGPAREHLTEARPVRGREFDREERPGRSLEREARRGRELEPIGDEPPLNKGLDRDRAGRLRDDEPRRDRALVADERDDRPRGRELERERPLARDEARDLTNRAARRELDERGPKAREFERKPPFSKGAERVEARGSAREHLTEARGSAREHLTEARGPAREHVTEARGSAREHLAEPRGSAREHLTEARGPAREHLTEARGPAREHLAEARGSVREPLELEHEDALSARDAGVRSPRRDLDERALGRPRSFERERELDRERDRELDVRVGRREGGRDLDRDLARGPRREAPREGARDLDRDLATRRGARDLGETRVGARERNDLDEYERDGVRPARREFDERAALRGRGREDEREPARVRDLEVRGPGRELEVRPRREAELDDRPRRREERGEARANARERSDVEPRGAREHIADTRGASDDELGEPRRTRAESDRPLRSRAPDVGHREPPGRDLRKRGERGDEERGEEEPGFAARAVSSRERDERIERDRPSRVRARARNRERIRELERERERE